MRPTAVLASALARLATVLTAAVPGGYGGGEGGGGEGDGGGGEGGGGEGDTRHTAPKLLEQGQSFQAPF